MAQWTTFTHRSDYALDAVSLKKHWKRLHAGDQEPWPSDAKVVAAWVHFHNGAFEKAMEAGIKAGGAGITVANKATCIYAQYLEPKEKVRLDLFMEVAERATQQIANEPDNANAYYWQGYAIGRYSQGISVAKALARGLGGKVKSALEKTLSLQPAHADAHVNLGTFHAEVIDKVGVLIGAMTYGAKKDVGMQHFQRGLELCPKSPHAMVSYADGMVMIEGEKRLDEATQLYEKVATLRALDAYERLEIELAQAELAD